jgi:hypothetical protein
MIRDDVDVLPSWLEHVCTFADVVIVVDHNSKEDLQAFVQCHENAHYLRVTHEKHLHEEVVNFILKELAIAVKPNTILMPLDADEFPLKRYIHEIMKASHDSGVYSATWMNCVLCRKSGPDNIVKLEDTVKAALINAKVPKLAVRAEKFRTRVYLRYGNHEMLDAFGNQVPPGILVDFGILHLPIRSEGQLERKLSNGIRACENAGWLSRILGINFHWREADLAIRTGLTQSLSDFLAEFVANYGLPMRRWQASRFTAEFIIRDCLMSDSSMSTTEHQKATLAEGHD